MQAQIVVNQQALQTQLAALQNDFCGLPNAQRETYSCRSDVIAGGAGGTGRGTPPAPFAPAAVLPAPLVATVRARSEEKL